MSTRSAFRYEVHVGITVMKKNLVTVKSARKWGAHFEDTALRLRPNVKKCAIKILKLRRDTGEVVETWVSDVVYGTR